MEWRLNSTSNISTEPDRVTCARLWRNSGIWMDTCKSFGLQVCAFGEPCKSPFQHKWHRCPGLFKVLLPIGVQRNRSIFVENWWTQTFAGESAILDACSTYNLTQFQSERGSFSEKVRQIVVEKYDVLFCDITDLQVRDCVRFWTFLLRFPVWKRTKPTLQLNTDTNLCSGSLSQPESWMRIWEYIVGMTGTNLEHLCFRWRTLDGLSASKMLSGKRKQQKVKFRYERWFTKLFWWSSAFLSQPVTAPIDERGSAAQIGSFTFAAFVVVSIIYTGCREWKASSDDTSYDEEARGWNTSEHNHCESRVRSQNYCQQVSSNQSGWESNQRWISQTKPSFLTWYQSFL